jgi:AcrR family transcriptional regulator
MTADRGTVNWVNIVSIEMSKTTSLAQPSKRSYVLKRRGDQQAETRQRIVEATVGLHQEVGPAATQVAEIARRAGVQRATVYNHFPDDSSLLAACSAHWRGLHPMPGPQQLSTTADVRKRLRLGLRELYAWFRETRSMTGNVLRDAQTIPALGQLISGGLLRNLDLLAGALAEPLQAAGADRERVQLAARAAVDFNFWLVLEPLGDDSAAELGAALIELAAKSES